MQRLLPGVIAMAAIVVASNILVQFLILDGLLTWGAFTYPFAFLVTDLMNRVYGPAAARRVVFVGFVAGILCSLIGSQIMLQGDGYEYAAVALRVAVGSGIAFVSSFGSLGECRVLGVTSVGWSWLLSIGGLDCVVALGGVVVVMLAVMGVWLFMVSRVACGVL